MNLRQQARLLHCSNNVARHRRRRAHACLLLIAPILAAFSTQSADTRDFLGLFEGWAAFRDAAPPRCYAVAMPVKKSRSADEHPFLAVADWPASGATGQVHVRLRKPRKADAPVTLSIGKMHFRLVGAGRDAWASGPGADRAIVAAVRHGTSLSIETVDERGRPLIDVYRLAGAPSAIDAAILACARPG
ncbi:MAG TPA: hypothetical protein VNZ43_11875 [Sphingomonadaceae bacterium]|nr:hypothetical protein [Sphingomonadaceae bacterium]